MEFESNHEMLIRLFKDYLVENEKFEGKNNKAAATRARKALIGINKATKNRRQEIQERKKEI